MQKVTTAQWPAELAYTYIVRVHFLMNCDPSRCGKSVPGRLGGTLGKRLDIFPVTNMIEDW